MLKRSRSRNSKQSLMAEYTSKKSATESYKKPTPFYFNSPRLFNESIASPTSILDTKPYSVFKNPFWVPDPSTPKTPKSENRTQWDCLGLIDALTDEKPERDELSKPKSRMVLFGSQLKIQIPNSAVLSPTDSPKSPADFGLKTRNMNLVLPSPRKSAFGSDDPNSPRVFAGSLSVDEMELFEDYTRVITHGPNPKTTHIFDDCIVESCCGVMGLCGSKRENGSPVTRSTRYPTDSFLSFCYNCRKNLDHGTDIFIYRGEKAFCSSECRYEEIISDEGMEDS